MRLQLTGTDEPPAALRRSLRYPLPAGPHVEDSNAAAGREPT
jgi:hypothetical protein